MLTTNEPILMQIDTSVPSREKGHEMIDLGIERSNVKLYEAKDISWRSGEGIILDPNGTNCFSSL